MARMKAKAQAKGGARGPGRGVAALRRPAGADTRGEGRGDHLASWEAGHTLRGAELTVDWALKAQHLVVEEAQYFHKACKVAGEVLGAGLSGAQVCLRLRPTGTTDEAILKLQSGTPHLELRVILCPSDCNHEEAAEDLVHGARIRKRKGPGQEEPWVDNLLKVAPPEGEDELARLRGHLARDGETPLRKEPGEAEAVKVKKKKKEKAKEKKTKKEKEKSRTKKRGSSSQASTSGEVALDGSRARLAAQKPVRSLFGGTGMDPSEKVRNKVIKLAKKYVRKKGKRSSSGSGSSSESSRMALLEDEGDTVFQQAARVRGIADSYPGVLSFQALSQMRSNLMQGLGEEDHTSSTRPVAVQYYRQVLQKKCSGGVARELLSLCATADFLVKGRVTQALDLVFQRIKSAESTLNGTHWTVSQKLELLPAEQATLTGVPEMKEAQKIAFEESKTRWMASLPEGRPSNGPKGSGKGKQSGKEDFRKGSDARKGGKAQGQKGDWKKKDEGGGAKAS